MSDLIFSHSVIAGAVVAFLVGLGKALDMGTNHYGVTPREHVGDAGW
ncbi:MAG TPA: hypothetical protein VE093_36275 [Polyangiaceae bacterium]|jgi:hypothetical protein|nr:hypothetical protein [Polyangiaceae bacterium]